MQLDATLQLPDGKQIPVVVEVDATELGNSLADTGLADVVARAVEVLGSHRPAFRVATAKAPSFTAGAGTARGKRWSTRPQRNGWPLWKSWRIPRHWAMTTRYWRSTFPPISRPKKCAAVIWHVGIWPARVRWATAGWNWAAPRCCKFPRRSCRPKRFTLSIPRTPTSPGCASPNGTLPFRRAADRAPDWSSGGVSRASGEWAGLPPRGTIHAAFRRFLGRRTRRKCEKVVRTGSQKGDNLGVRGPGRFRCSRNNFPNSPGAQTGGA